MIKLTYGLIYICDDIRAGLPWCIREEVDNPIKSAYSTDELCQSIFGEGTVNESFERMCAMLLHATGERFLTLTKVPEGKPLNPFARGVACGPNYHLVAFDPNSQVYEDYYDHDQCGYQTMYKGYEVIKVPGNGLWRVDDDCVWGYGPHGYIPLPMPDEEDKSWDFIFNAWQKRQRFSNEEQLGKTLL